MAKASQTTASKNELATIMSGKLPEILVPGLEIARRVTVPLKLIQTGEEAYLRIEGELSGGEESHARKGFDKAMTVCPVIDLLTGESVTLIVSSVLESALKRVPGGYVGKSFYVMQGPKMPGKRYHQVEVFELRPKTGAKG